MKIRSFSTPSILCSVVSPVGQIILNLISFFELALKNNLFEDCDRYPDPAFISFTEVEPSSNVAVTFAPMPWAFLVLPFKVTVKFFVCSFLTDENPLSGPSLLEMTRSGNESPLKSDKHTDLASSGMMLPLS